MIHSEPDAQRAVVPSRRRLLWALAALVLMGGVSAGLFSRDNRSWVTMTILGNSLGPNGELVLHYSLTMDGRVVHYSLEERHASGSGSTGSGRRMTIPDWVVHILKHGRSTIHVPTQSFLLWECPPEIVPPAGTVFKAFSGEAKVILSTGEGETKREFTLRCK